MSGGAVERAQPIGQFGFIPGREQRRRQHQVGHTIAERGERALRGIAEHEFGAKAAAHHRGQVVRLPPVWFNRKYQRHPYVRSMKIVSTVPASTTSISGRC